MTTLSLVYVYLCSSTLHYLLLYYFIVVFFIFPLHLSLSTSSHLPSHLFLYSPIFIFTILMSVFVCLLFSISDNHTLYVLLCGCMYLFCLFFIVLCVCLLKMCECACLCEIYAWVCARLWVRVRERVRVKCDK